MFDEIGRGSRGEKMILMFFWLLGLSVFDIRCRRVPVWLIMIGGIVAVGNGICECICGRNNFMVFFAGMIPGMILLLLAMGTQNVGWVDGVILMLAGSVLGLQRCILAAGISLIMISVLAVALLNLKKVNKRTKIPYIPFLTVGIMLCRLA